MDEPDDLMSIGTFARRSGLSRKALRIYAGQDLLPPARIDDASGYRYYRADQVALARRIVMLRALDMPLATIRVALGGSDRDFAETVAAFWADRESVHAARRSLVAFLTDSPGGTPMSDVRTRALPARHVLWLRGDLTADQVPEFVATNIERIARPLQAKGLLTGPPFVRYHGELEDDPAPVDFCCPVAGPAGDVAPTVGGAQVAAEAATEEAYVGVPKAEMRTLVAFEKLHRWFLDHDFTDDWAWQPRQTFLVDPDTVGDDAIVYEIGVTVPRR